MKKTLLIVGIVIIVIGVLSLLAGLLFWFVRTNTLDGSSSFYDRQKRMMIIHLIIGAVVSIIGTVSVIISRISLK